jgi:hypothetical protein
MLTYNLFRHKDEAGLYCAVPEDVPVPAFLSDDEWVYSCPIDNRLLARFDTSLQSSTVGGEAILLQTRREPESHRPKIVASHT